MRRNLQSKFNLLAVVLIVFSLLMLPMFNQVKADTRGSLKEAKNTWMSKMFRDLSRDFKPRNLENTEVEDYWAEQAKKQDPNCGANCDPNADRDGDGVSNGDEVRQGRNPSCNEEKLGVDYCKGQDPYNLTDPDPVVERVERSMVANLTWRFSDCASGQPIATSCGAAKPFSVPLPENVTLLDGYLNVTGYSGTGFSVTVRTGSQTVLSFGGAFEPQPRNLNMARDSQDDPPAGSYTGSLTFQPNAAQSGTWNLQVWATRVVK